MFLHRSKNNTIFFRSPPCFSSSDGPHPSLSLTLRDERIIPSSFPPCFSSSEEPLSLSLSPARFLSPSLSLSPPLLHLVTCHQRHGCVFTLSRCLSFALLFSPPHPPRPPPSSSSPTASLKRPEWDLEKTQSKANGHF